MVIYNVVPDEIFGTQNSINAHIWIVPRCFRIMVIRHFHLLQTDNRPLEKNDSWCRTPLTSFSDGRFWPSVSGRGCHCKQVNLHLWFVKCNLLHILVFLGTSRWRKKASSCVDEKLRIFLVLHYSCPTKYFASLNFSTP
jgi:hypothetical protein